MTLDQIDTPSVIARKMVDSAQHHEKRVIADFAAGTGSLLGCAAERWPNALILGVDVCRSRAYSLRSMKPGWKIGNVDFLKAASRSRCKALKGMEGKVSLILLNPPFSCRGAMTVSTSVDGEAVSSSLAMAFVLTSLPFLAHDGEIIVVLPASVLSSEKDKFALCLLRRRFAIEVIEHCDHRCFQGLSVRTVVVRMAPRSGLSLISQERQGKPVDQGYTVELVRGRIQMHAIPVTNIGRLVPLLHTTELVESKLRPAMRFVESRHSIRGPMILIPRVGEPNIKKVVLVASDSSMALSDCVIALRCSRKSDLMHLYSMLLKNWESVAALYGGACARYVTLRNLSECLIRMGFNVDLSRRPVEVSVLNVQVESRMGAV